MQNTDKLPDGVKKSQQRARPRGYGTMLSHWNIERNPLQPNRRHFSADPWVDLGGSPMIVACTLKMLCRGRNLRLIQHRCPAVSDT